MKLELFVVKTDSQSKIPVSMSKMSKSDAKATVQPSSQWQTSWLSDYIADSKFLKYALKTADEELIALGAYEIQQRCVVVNIVYIESHPDSNPTMTKTRKYTGIGKAMIAYGIALSVNNGCEGCVMFEAKTSSLAKHYVEDFGAIPLHSWDGAPPRFMIEADCSHPLRSGVPEGV